MKKSFFILTLIAMLSSVFAVYQVGDVVDDFSWTDNYGDEHSIYELTSSGKAVVFFWGSTG